MLTCADCSYKGYVGNLPIEFSESACSKFANVVEMWRLCIVISSVKVFTRRYHCEFGLQTRLGRD